MINPGITNSCIFERDQSFKLIKSKRTYLLLLLSCFTVSDLKAQHEHLLNKTHGQRYSYMFTMYQDEFIGRSADSSTSFKTLNAIAKTASENDDEDLLLETELLSALFYSYRNPLVGEVKLSQLLEEARKKNKIWLEARIEGALALNSQGQLQFEKMFDHYHRVYDLIANMSMEEYPDKQNILYCFADALFLFRDYRAAIFYLKEGLKDTLIRPWNSYAVSGPNLIGLCYRELNILDSSDIYFSFIYEHAVKKADKRWVGISSGNLGYNCFLRKEYEKAKPLLQKDADISIFFGDELWLASTALTTLAEISLEQNDIATAERQLMLARACTYHSGPHRYKRFRALYPVLSRYYMAVGKLDPASTFFDSSFIVRDSLDKAFNSLLLTRVQQKVELEKHRAAIEKVNSEKQMQVLQRNVLIGLFVPILVIAFFVYDRQKRRHKHNNLLLLQTKKELEHASNELNTFTRNIAEKNQLIEELRNQMGDPDSEAIRQLQQSHILTDEHWNDFRNLFDKVHSGFLHRLKEKLPGLTPAETRFVALSKLKLSNKEMAAMLGIGTDAIRQHRSRLRKKLELTEEDNLEELLEKI